MIDLGTLESGPTTSKQAARNSRLYLMAGYVLFIVAAGAGFFVWAAKRLRAESQILVVVGLVALVFCYGSAMIYRETYHRLKAEGK